MKSNELLLATEYLEKEKRIPREVLVDAIEAALITAYKKNYESARNVRVELNLDSGTFHVIARKEVVEEVFDDREEIDLSTALVKNPAYEIGDIYEEDVTPKDFGRVGAQAAKQAVMQRLRDAEREILYEEFIDKEDDIVTGVIDRVDHRYVYVNLGRTEAVLSEAERSPNETYLPNERIKVYVNKVEQTTKGPQIFVSRSHPGLLKRLFEQEVPEIFEGTVEVKSVAREAGDRSKISVYAENGDIDAVGACVGAKGARVEAVVEELGGEKIDIVQWDADPKVFVRNALSPSQVVDVIVDEENQSTTVIVPDYQLSLAIGKRGQNARLAAKLTGWKIDIKSESDAKALGLDQPQPVVAEADDEEVAVVDEEALVDDVNEDVVVLEDEIEEKIGGIFMKKRKIPMRKCILSNEMKPKKEMIRVVQNKEGDIAADATGKMQGRGAYVSKDVALVEQAQQAQKLESFFKAPQETLEPVYKEIIRLIYREEIPTK